MTELSHMSINREAVQVETWIATLAIHSTSPTISTIEVLKVRDAFNSEMNQLE